MFASAALHPLDLTLLRRQQALLQPLHRPNVLQEDLSISQSSDDCHVQSDGVSYSHVATNVNVLYSISVPAVRWFGGLRFVTSGIHSGAQVLGATLTVHAQNTSYDDPDFELVGQADDNPPTFSAGDNPFHRAGSRTVQSVMVTRSSVGVGPMEVDVRPVVQELVHRSGFGAGSALVLLLLARTASAHNFRFRSLDFGDPNQAPRLRLRYVNPPGG